MPTPRRGIAKPIVAPVGGWNALDPWDTMKETDAIELINWFPTTNSVQSRSGYVEHSTGLTGQVETLAEYNAGTTRQLIAAAGSNIYNASSDVAVSLGSGFSNARWQTTNFDGRLGMVNGADLGQQWDGTTLSDLVTTGITSDNLIVIHAHRSRVWYGEKDSASVWYSAIDTLGGALTEFPLGRVGNKGGIVTAIGTWTRDSGDGADDWIVFIMSSGEILLYSGDPASTFNLIGIFETAEPLSNRCTLKFGSTLWLMTREGTLDLQSVLALGKVAYDKAITNKIRDAFTRQTDVFGPQFGWQPIHYPKQSMVLFNVPVNIDSYEQYVVNTRTKAWCRFQGMNAFCWEKFNDDLFFGGDGVVYQADEGFNDNGNDIVLDGITAFSYLGSPANKKQVTMIQPSLRLNGNLVDNITLGTDFQLPPEPGDINIVQVGGTPWGSPWGSPWSGEREIEDNYTAVTGWGYNFAMRLKMAINRQQTNWYSNRWVFKRGGLV